MRDALIVGAGPVGLTMALACRRHGVSFRLVDKLPVPSGLSKALAVWSAALEMLDSLGVAEQFAREAIHGKGLRISRAKRLLVEVPAGLGLDTPFPGMLLLPQARSEAILSEKLVAAGGAIERGLELVSLDQLADRVRAGLRRPGARVEEEEFRWVVACDGAHSTARHLVGAEFEGAALEQTFVLCDAEIAGDIAPDYAHLFWPDEGLLAVFPVTPGVWRVISTRADPENAAEVTLAEMQELLDRRGPGGWSLSNPTWLSKFRISERKAVRYRHGRVLLAGDAAHIHSPAGGQGMNTGMQDAANLAWKLGLLSAGFGSEEAILDSYHAERSPVAEKVLSESGRMLRAGFIKNPVFRFLRDGAARIAGRSLKFRAEMMRSLSGLDISYPAGHLVAGDLAWHEDWRPHGFAPGHRIRDAGVFRDSEKVSLLQEVPSRFFTLLIFSGRKPIYRDVDRLQAVQLVAEGYGDLVRVINVWHGKTVPSGDWLADPDASAHKRFGVAHPAFYLIRPDRHVALRSQPAEAGVLQEWLKAVTEPRGGADGFPLPKTIGRFASEL